MEMSLKTLEVIPRSVLSLIILFVATKMIGKKQVSELSLFDYVIGISIGNFAAEMTVNTDVPFFYGVIAVFVFGFIALFVSWITMKNIKLRRLIIGKPNILVKRGKLLEENFRKTKYDIHDFLEQCRIGGYFDVSQIEYAIVEANGKLTILPKAEYQPVTPKDMNLKVDPSRLVANIIVDGHIMGNALNDMHKDEEWLKKELKIKGYTSYEPILLATLDAQEKLVVYEKNLQATDLDILE